MTPTSLTSPSSLLQVCNLSKRVTTADGELTLLSEIEFNIGQGEAVAVVGPSGSGKSTLLGLLAGLDVPSAGQVLVDGTDLFTLDEDGRAALRAARMGFVFQSFQLLANLTALENVLLPLELFGRADAEDVARRVLERVGLAARLNHFPRQLSGGEQQRVAIARAFAPQPQLLLADEPTGSLDVATGERVVDLLFALKQEHGSTLILVTHDERLAARCDRSLALDAGRIRSIRAN